MVLKCIFITKKKAPNTGIMFIVVFHKTIAPKLFPIISCSHAVLIGTRLKENRRWETNRMKNMATNS